MLNFYGDGIFLVIKYDFSYQVFSMFTIFLFLKVFYVKSRVNVWINVKMGN